VCPPLISDLDLKILAPIFFGFLVWHVKTQLKYGLVGLMVVGAEIGREYHGSIPAIVIERGLEPLDARTDSKTRLNWR
jgi:hypothetical protein